MGFRFGGEGRGGRVTKSTVSLCCVCVCLTLLAAQRPGCKEGSLRFWTLVYGGFRVRLG